MKGINKAILVGRLGADPDCRQTQSGKSVAEFRVATEDYQGNTEWHRVVCWDKKAEFAQGYLGKGDMVYVEGSIKTRQWEDKEGNKRYTTEVVAWDLQGLVYVGKEKPAEDKKGLPF